MPDLRLKIGHRIGEGELLATLPEEVVATAEQHERDGDAAAARNKARQHQDTNTQQHKAEDLVIALSLRQGPPGLRIEARLVVAGEGSLHLCTQRLGALADLFG